MRGRATISTHQDGFTWHAKVEAMLVRKGAGDEIMQVYDALGEALSEREAIEAAHRTLSVRVDDLDVSAQEHKILRSALSAIYQTEMPSVYEYDVTIDGGGGETNARVSQLLLERAEEAGDAGVLAYRHRHRPDQIEGRWWFFVSGPDEREAAIRSGQQVHRIWIEKRRVA